MFKERASITWSKTLKFRMPTHAFFHAKVGQAAFDMIRKRITTTGKLHTGRQLPRNAGGWFIVPTNDKRFKGGRPTNLVMTPAGPVATKGKPKSRLFGSYADAKRASGAGNRKTMLTGEMWKHGRVTVGIRKGRVTIAIGFKGSQVVSEFSYPFKTRIKDRKVIYRTKKTRVRHQDKATGLQKRKPDGTPTTSPQFQLMGLTTGEFARIVDAFTRAIRLTE